MKDWPQKLDLLQFTRLLLGGALALAGFSFSTFAQDTHCAELKAAKARVYGFHPTDLNQDQQNKKSAEMDVFWDLAKAQGPNGASCVREMILAEKNDSFFQYDASSLLYTLDRSADSLNAILQGISSAELKDINPVEYVRFLLRLSREGMDIGPLAGKYLAFPKVEAYVPQHAMTLYRQYGAIILYGSMTPAKVDEYLIPALAAKEDYVRYTVAVMLAMNMTRQDFQVLFAARETANFPPNIKQQVEATLRYTKPSVTAKPRFSREQVLAFLKQIPAYSGEFPGVADNEPFLSSAMATLTEADLDALCEARRKAIAGVSDEAIYEYMALSQILLGVIDRLELYREFRIAPAPDKSR